MLVTAAGAVTATALADGRADAIDAVICPVQMPDGDGQSLVRGLRRRFPHIKAVYLARDAAEWAARLPGELVLPAEPLPVEALAGWAQAMESSLERRTGPPRRLPVA